MCFNLNKTNPCDLNFQNNIDEMVYAASFGNPFWYYILVSQSFSFKNIGSENYIGKSKNLCNIKYIVIGINYSIILYNIDLENKNLKNKYPKLIKYKT